MEMKKKRAVVYCRVSTQEQAQKDALKVQVEEAVRASEGQGWLLADRYVETESATTAEGRKEYLRLISDMRWDKFDIIVIKSLDRMNRNAKDWYLFLDELVAHDKLLYIYMEREFYRADNNLLTGIKVILAEQYSRDLSKKINNAHAYRQANGTTVLLTNNTYGFRKNRDKSVSVIPEEAETIRRMYDMTAQGYGSRAVSAALYRDGVTNRGGNQITETTIRRIIRNPLFKGTAVMNKAHFDFEKKKIIKNPSSEWISHANLVPAIVDEELWEQANRMMDLNRKKCAAKNNKKKAEIFHFNFNFNFGFSFSGKIRCGECGAPYYKTFRRRAADPEETIIEWKCSNYLRGGRKFKNRRDKMRKILPQKILDEKNLDEKILDEKILDEKNLDEKKWNVRARGCDNIHLKNSELTEMIERIAHEIFDADWEGRWICQIMDILKRVLIDASPKGQKESLQKCLQDSSRKKQLLLDKLLAGVVSDVDYQKKQEELTQKEELWMKKIRQEEEREEVCGRAEGRLLEIQKKLQEGGAGRILSELFFAAILKITVHEEELLIQLNPDVLAQMAGKDQSAGALAQMLCKDPEDGGCLLRVRAQDYLNGNRQAQERKKARLLELLAMEPTLTAKKLAEQLGISLSMARRWMDGYRRQGILFFDGKGGKGMWVVR